MVLATAVAAAPQLNAMRGSLRPPRNAPAPGDTFRVPVYLHDSGQDLVSYALQVRYDPRVLEIQAIDGGTFAGFAERPITDAAAFTTGATRFASVNRGVLRTHRTVNVATIVFRVVGGSGAQTKIRLAGAGHAPVVVKRGFEARALKTPAPLVVTIR
jgi:hypothetical protein